MDPMYLMVSGDARASEDIPLTVLHTIWAREHNRQANRYKAIWPHASDEQIFQLARRYTIAEYQKVIYEEFIPSILGGKLPKYSGYKSDIDPRTSTAFATGAFRYGHSVARDFDIYDGCSTNGDSKLQMYDNTNLFAFLGITFSGTRLFFQGQIFRLNGVQGTTAFDYEPARIIALMGGRHGDGFDNMLSSFIRQRSAKFDSIVANTLRNIVGVADLLSTDIFRGRENGLPNYNTLRTYYGAGNIYKNSACPKSAAVDSNACWAILTSNRTIASALKRLYRKVNQVDGLIGLMAEDVPSGAYLAPTTVGIIRKEFIRKRDGDRFFYENPYYFLRSERAAIKSTTFANIIKRNTGLIGLPANVFLTNEFHNTGKPRSTHCS
ncbi:heme peroxidase [Jimgerdemannia flammicorona]|nr:heme peroxidase [Jimgerdemannia flammicorona]